MARRPRWHSTLAVAVAASLIGAATALADTAVIPDTPDLPWTEPSHNSPLERVATAIATEIAGREARVYCNGQNDWEIVVASGHTDAWGFVPRPRLWFPATRTFADSSPATQLAPIACEHLWKFAKASTKPTRCESFKTVTRTTDVEVRYRAQIPVKTTKRVKVKGLWRIKTVTVKKPVWRTRTEARTTSEDVPLSPVPCYGQPAAAGITLSPPAGGWEAYVNFVKAIQTLAHEAIHLFDGTAGKSVDVIGTTNAAESRAECLGMQNIARVAKRLGAGEDDAVSIARYYAEQYYPRRQQVAPDYWSPECKPGGTLDLTPSDGSWP